MDKGKVLVGAVWDLVTPDEFVALDGLPLEVRLARAKDTESPEEVLRHLSKDGFWFVRDHVASNPSTPKDCLVELMKDEDFRVRSEARKTYIGGGFMKNSENVSSIALREALQQRLEHPYEKQNDYYAWKKPDGTLFMVGMECYQMNHLLKYEYDPFFKDYGAKFYSIDSHAVHMRGPHQYDPVQELVSQVEKYEYLGAWRDPEIFMETENGRVAAHGRWEEAKAHIVGEIEKQPSVKHVASEQVQNAAQAVAKKEPGKAYACNGVPIFDGYGRVMSEEDAERLEASWERAENYAMDRSAGNGKKALEELIEAAAPFAGNGHYGGSGREQGPER